jgi:hypothetical protein
MVLLLLDFALTAGTLTSVNSIIKVLPETTYFPSSRFKRLFTDFIPLISLIFAANGYEFTIHPASSAPPGVYPERIKGPSP